MKATRIALRWISVLETVSFIGLLTAMAVGSDVGVTVLGAIHGLLFLAFMAVIFMGRRELGWSTPYVALAVLTGPIGAVLVLERLRREETGVASTA